ncbi:histidine kinase [Stenotrophomonas sp. 22385]|uniref:sensor histidine kinase n=1 Tax=Stenotrophomonas sp. 22385 TaxID=3453915 RepID=UPI003F86F991
MWIARVDSTCSHRRDCGAVAAWRQVAPPAPSHDRSQSLAHPKVVPRYGAWIASVAIPRISPRCRVQAGSQVNQVEASPPDTVRSRLPFPRRKRFTSSPLDVRVLITTVLPLLVGCMLGHWLPTLADAPRLHVLWVPGPLLLGWLLFTPRNQWRRCLLAACAGTVLSLLLVPLSALPRLLASLGEFTMAAVVAWLLLRWRGERAALEDYRDLTLFLLLACVLLPLCGAWWYALALGGRGDALEPAAMREFALTSSVSYLLLVPALVNLARILDAPERRHGWHWRNAGLALVLMAVLVMLWTVDWQDGVVTPLLTLAPIPLLVWTLIVFGIAGASMTLLAVAVLGMQLGLESMGPFGFWTPERNLLTGQAWTLCTGLALLFLGALSEQKLSNRIKLQRAYARLGEVTGRMLVVQEEERTRIARDLHDDVNQSLAAISIRLSTLRNHIPPAERPSVVELQDQLLSVSNDIRAISHELHPSILRFTGLASALDAFCIKRNARGRLRVRCSIEDAPHLDDEQELSLFRIVQEAVNNVDKHAQASVADVLVCVRGQNVVLRVDDDGVGILDSRLRRTPGLGLISMEERARLLAGTLHVGTSPLGGARIEVRFPLRDAAPRGTPGQ